ncbi:MAG: PP2C family protein-serine/threonine phosphatase [Acidobacteria bacterium]|nr:PP2C family protein-serine/threonine phosphatase [Acidobacteriota bacterium]
MAAVSLPVRAVGGDYHDVICVDGHRFALCVADVSGKGLSAALLMANVQAVVRSLVLSAPPVETLAGRTNALVCRNTGGEHFVTLFFGVLDTAEHRFRYVNAGHNPPILLRKGRPALELTEGGLILGVLEDAVYEPGAVDLEPGDLLVMFSDGVTEAWGEGGAEYGTTRLLETVAACLEGNDTAAGIRDCILRSVRRHAGPKGPGDDLTLLVLRRLPPEPKGVECE